MLRLQLYWHFICDSTSVVDLIVVVVVVVLRSSKMETQAAFFFFFFFFAVGEKLGRKFASI